MKRKEHPMQPIVRAKDGVIRFKPNAILAYLCDRGAIDLNALAVMKFPREDREQLAQLIGYSVSGFGELNYVRRKTLRRADKRAARLLGQP